MKQYTNEMIKEIIADISKMPVNKPEEIRGNMDEFTTRFTWDSVKQVLETMPKEKHFEFISSLFVMTVFHQAVFTYFYGLDKHFAKQPGEYTKYRSRYQLPEFGWSGMEGTKHEDVWDLFTYALNDNVISLDDLNSRRDEVAELFKAWSKFLIEDCQLNITYGKMMEALCTDYTLDVRLKVRNQQRKDFPSEYVSAMENLIRKMLGIYRILSKHRKGLDYLKDK